MTRIDFYILPNVDENSRLEFTCRLVEKIYGFEHKILILMDSPESSEKIDRRLWEFKPDSFIPHGQELHQPVAITCGEEPGDHHEVLINLNSEIPPFFSRFDRLAEVVSQQADLLEKSRQRWKWYKDRGYPLELHNLKNS